MTSALAPFVAPQSRAVQSARGALAEVADATWWSASAEELSDALRETLALRAQVDALLHGLLREADGRGVGRELGAHDTIGWMKSVGRIDRREGDALLRVAHGTDPDGAAGWTACPQ